MNFGWPYLLGLLFLTTASGLRAGDWSLDIVPNGSYQTKQYIDLREPFYVVLTNNTPRPLTVWKEGCSWGYFNLSFELTSKDGRLVHVQKKRVGFTRNFPKPFLVGPGRHFVLAVILKDTDDSWINTGALDGLMTVRAIYKNTNEAFPGNKHVPPDHGEMGEFAKQGWIGEVDSDSLAVTITR